jgi:Flp pilus assembly protein TadD
MHECFDKLVVQLGADSEHLVLLYQYCALEAMNIKRDAKLAMRNLDKALQVDKKGVWYRNTRYYRGCVFEDLLGDDKSAETEYRTSVEGEWNMDTPSAADRLARLLAIRGELDEAESLWVRAAKLRPDDVEIQHNLLVLRRAKAAKK